MDIDELKKYEEEFVKKVPPNLKVDIGSFFVGARCIDPTIKISYTRSLVSSLQTAMVLCGNTRYDSLIEWAKTSSTTALALYLKDEWGAGVDLCDVVLDNIGFLVYSGYGTMESNSFTIPTMGGKK